MTIGTTRTGQAIAAWMVKGNPHVYDVGTFIANPHLHAEASWNLHPTYRVDLVDADQLVLLWVTKGPNSILVPGIWLLGHTTGPATVQTGDGSARWRDVAKGERRAPYLPAQFETLAKPITREELVQHPVLRELEVLKSTAMSNPQIVTPEQLAALRTDFDLTTGPLPDDVLAAISGDYPELEILTGENRWLEVHVDEDESVLCDEHGDEISRHETWREAFRAAAIRAHTEAPITDEKDEEWNPVARYLDGQLVIIRVGPESYRVWELSAEEEIQWADTYVSVDAAVEALIEELPD